MPVAVPVAVEVGALRLSPPLLASASGSSTRSWASLRSCCSRIQEVRSWQQYEGIGKRDTATEVERASEISPHL